jgi:hypothetical protein
MNERFTKAALALCARHEEIGEKTRQARAVPGCESALRALSVESYLPGASPDPYLECTDRIPYVGPAPYENPETLKWWEASEAQIEAMCVPCQSRVALWRERRRLRAGLGGLMRSLRAAYRAVAQAEGR